MKIGYARVSTKDQNLDLQIEALEKEVVRKFIRRKFQAQQRIARNLIK